MAKKKKQKQQLDKRINTALAAILIAIIGATACEMLLWGDWRAQNAELKTTCEAVKKEADIASQAPIELAEVRSQINELKKEIAEANQNLDEKLMAKISTPEIIKMFEDLAVSEGVLLKNISLAGNSYHTKTDSVPSITDYQTENADGTLENTSSFNISFSMEYEATYAELFKFIEDVESQDYYVLVNSLTMEGTPKDSIKKNEEEITEVQVGTAEDGSPIMAPIAGMPEEMVNELLGRDENGEELSPNDKLIKYAETFVESFAVILRDAPDKETADDLYKSTMNSFLVNLPEGNDGDTTTLSSEEIKMINDIWSVTGFSFDSSLLNDKGGYGNEIAEYRNEFKDSQVYKGEIKFVFFTLADTSEEFMTETPVVEGETPDAETEQEG